MAQQCRRAGGGGSPPTQAGGQRPEDSVAAGPQCGAPPRLTFQGWEPDAGRLVLGVLGVVGEGGGLKFVGHEAFSQQQWVK